MAAGGHFGWPKITFDCISRHFRSIRNFFFHKMADNGHFGWPKITFECISCHFRSIRNFYLFIFLKMAAGGHFGWPKITFDCISRHFRSIRNFFFSQNGWQRPFWMTGNHLWSHFSPFQINTQLFFFSKWLPAAILDDRKSLLITFLTISDQYATTFFSTKWLPAAILDDRKSLSNAFLAISDQYATSFFWIFFPKWPPAATFGHFRWAKITFDRISWNFFRFFFQNGRQRPFWKSDLRQKQ